MRIEEDDLYEISGPLDLTCFAKFAEIPGFDHLRQSSIQPQWPLDLPPGDNLFEAIRDKDILLHHPYESFLPVLNFVRTAAEDPQVLAIKQTLYRVSGNSPLIRSLAQAAENGKQVTVVVEIMARFDEENNINWARRLEEAGCHVIYGLNGYKVHSKLCLISRKTEQGVSYVTQIGTGNYNEKTSALYTDLSLITGNQEIGKEAAEVFAALLRGETVEETHLLLVAPKCLQNKVLDMIE